MLATFEKLKPTCENDAAGASPAEPQAVSSSPAVSDPAPPAAGQQNPEPPAVDPPPRPPKSKLLPEIARLSLEGHSNRAIARKLGIPTRTVDRWVAQLRHQWGENSAQNYVELHAIAMARLETVYREAMDAWRNSREDKQVTVEPLDGDDTKKKGSRRKTTQSGQAALLRQATLAATEIAKVNAKHISCVKAYGKNEPSRKQR